MASNKLNVFGGVNFDETIEKDDLHTYLPYGNTTFNYTDEIRILIQSQDLITDICESFIYIEGKITCAEDGKIFSLSNNFACFLFDEIRYEIGGQKIDACRLPGITSAIKGYVSYTSDESKSLASSGWQPKNDTLQVQHTVNNNEKSFAVAIPLKHIFGFAEDYKHAIINMRQELILIRSRTDLDCFTGDTPNALITITKIHWKVPHIIPSDVAKLNLYNRINQNSKISIPFRQWELYELPALKASKTDTWPIRTSNQLEKPRWALVAFQKGHRNNHTAYAANFIDSNITNLKLFLNADSYPYENWNLDFGMDKYHLAYYQYANFQKAYYGGKETSALMEYDDFKTKPIFVIDCSKQKETLKNSTVDVKLEMEARSDFTHGTVAYCLILHDAIVEYNPLTGEVQRV